MIELSFIKRGQDTQKLSLFNLDSALREVYDMLKIKAEIEQTKLQYDCDSDLTVQSNERRIQMVFCNVLYNALKFARGESVDVKVKDEGPQVRVIVRDSGIGISSEKKQRCSNYSMPIKIKTTQWGLMLMET